MGRAKGKIGPTREKVLALLRTKHVAVTAEHVGQMLGISAAAAKDALRRLGGQGLAIREKQSCGTIGATWKAPEAEASAPPVQVVVAPSYALHPIVPPLEST